MKNKSILKRAIIIMSVAVVAVSSLFALAACNNDSLSFTDIFKSTVSPNEFNSYKHELMLPSNCSVYVPASANSDIGYIKELNAFVICNTTDSISGNLSLIKCNDPTVYFQDGAEGMVFPFSIGIAAMRVKDGLIAVKYSNGEAGVFDTNGKTVLSRTKVSNIGDSVNMDTAIKILDSGLIAVNNSYVKDCPEGYTAIFRPTTSGSLTERGELVCYIKNDDGALVNVNGFDKAYVSVVGNKEVNYLYYIPSTANGNPQRLTGGINGIIHDNGNDDYFCEITYIGGGRFLVHQDWTVNSTDNYTYYDGNDYYVFTRSFYYPQEDRTELYTANADKVFLTMTNSYYDSSKTGVDVKSYLNDGYMYASYGLFIVDRVGFYDQYILDENLNVVMSLTGNFGITIKGQSKDNVGVFDLIMLVTDGYAYMPIMPSDVQYYDSNGKLVGSNDKYTVLSQSMSDGMIVAEIVDPEDKDGKNTLYGAFDIKGNIAVEFKYSSLTSFRGYYALGVRKNDAGKNACYLVGKDGGEVELMSDGTTPFADIAMSGTGSSAAPIYKIGCYMYAATSTDAEGNNITTYGIKNLNANSSKNVIIPATMASGAVLYAPSNSPTDVFVFEKLTASDESVTYIIYRLTSPSNSPAETNNVGAIVGGTVGGIAFAAVVVTVVLLVLKKQGKLHKKTVNGDDNDDKKPIKE